MGHTPRVAFGARVPTTTTSVGSSRSWVLSASCARRAHPPARALGQLAKLPARHRRLHIPRVTISVRTPAAERTSTHRDLDAQAQALDLGVRIPQDLRTLAHHIFVHRVLKLARMHMHPLLRVANASRVLARRLERGRGVSEPDRAVRSALAPPRRRSQHPGAWP
jgi:hypothetical protein